MAVSLPILDGRGIGSAANNPRPFANGGHFPVGADLIRGEDELLQIAQAAKEVIPP
jgi:hypothetical protein